MTQISYNTQTLATFSNTALTTASTSMAASLYSNPFAIMQSNTFAMEFIWTGTPTGTLSVMGSLDGINFNVSLGTHALTGSAGNYTLDLASTGGAITSCGWVQGQYAFTSGSGTLTNVIAATKNTTYN